MVSGTTIGQARHYELGKKKKATAGDLKGALCEPNRIICNSSSLLTQFHDSWLLEKGALTSLIMNITKSCKNLLIRHL